MNNKIHLAGKFRAIEQPAGGTILPGMLCEYVPGATSLRAHSTSGGFAEKIIAFEDALQGGTAQGYFVNGAYVGYTVAGIDAVGPDPVQAGIETSGSLVLGLMKAGHAYTVGQKLMSNGDGTFIGVGGSEKQDIAVVVTALDLSASGAANALTQIRMM